MFFEFDILFFKYQSTPALLSFLIHVLYTWLYILMRSSSLRWLSSFRITYRSPLANRRCISAFTLNNGMIACKVYTSASTQHLKNRNFFTKYLRDNFKNRFYCQSWWELFAISIWLHLYYQNRFEQKQLQSAS